MLKPTDFISEPEESDILCKNCGHTLADHDADGFGCGAEFDEESGALCTCGLYEPWDSQPAEVYIPAEASLDELIAIRKAACADGRRAPTELSRRIQEKQDSQFPPSGGQKLEPF
jgi:hypothetical protein